MPDSIAFAIPILPGRTEKVLEMCDHMRQRDEALMARGEFRDSYAQRERGLKHARFYHQLEPLEALVIYLEGPNISDQMSDIAQYEHEVEQEFAQLVEAATGHKPVPGGKAPAHLILDWHHEEGHRHKNPRAHLNK